MPDSGRRPGGGDPSLNEIARADRFFEALASKQPAYPTDSAEAELAVLFSEFRDDVRDSPVTAPVSDDDAVEALRAGMTRDRGSRRGLALVGSVAAAMLCIGGFGTAVYGAGPGDSLYGMHTALFGQQEQTRDDQVSLASAQLQQVQQLIDQGQWEQAQDKLVQVSSAVQGVDQVQDKQQLVDQWNALTYKVVEQDPAATLPAGEPLPVLPSSPLTWLPVPFVEATTTGSTTTTTETTSPSGTETSETSPTSPTTDPSGAVVPPEVLVTPPSESPQSPSSTTTSTSTSTSAGPTTAPTTTATTTTTTTTSAPPTRTTTATSTVVPAKAPEAALPSSAVASTAPAVEVPASQPRVAPSSPAAPPPAVSAPSSAPVAPSQPAASTPAPERPSAPTTTTVASPAS